MTVRDEWRWTDDQGVQRLVKTEELRAALASKVLPPSTLVWREGMKEWLPAFTLPEFASAALSAGRGRDHRPEPRHEEVGDRSTPTDVMPLAPTHEPRRMRTLTGLTSPGGDRPSMPQAPIVVPSAAGEPAPRGGAITQQPRYSASASDAELPVIPQAPKVPSADPAPSKEASPAAPKAATPAPTVPQGRKARTSEIDALWAPSPSITDAPEDTETLVRPRNPGGKSEASARGEPAKPQQTATSPSANTSKAAPKKPEAQGPAGATANPSPRREPAIGPATVKGLAPHIPPAAQAKPQPPPSAGGGPASTPMALTQKKAPSLPPPPPRGRTLTPGGMAMGHKPPSIAPPLPEGRRRSTGASTPPPAAQPVAPARSARVETAAGAPAASAFAAPRTPSFTDQVRVDVSAAVKPPPARGPAATTPSEEAAARAAPSPAARTGNNASSAGATASESAAAERSHHAPASTPPPAATVSVAAGELAPPPPRAQPTHSDRPPPSADAGTSMPPPPGRLSLRQQVAVPMSSLFGAGGALIVCILFAFFFGRCSVDSGPSQDARRGLAALPLLTRQLVPSAPKPCWVARQPVMWAARASNKIPFDVTPTASGGFEIGYARDATEAAGVAIDSTSGKLDEIFGQKSEGEIERVAPVPEKLGSFVVSTSKSPLRSALPIQAPSPFLVGAGAGGIATADDPAATPSVIWPVGDGISSLRVNGGGQAGYAVTFRRENAIWAGWLGADRQRRSEIARVVGSGGSVGKPMSGWNGVELAVTFADKPTDGESWELRLAHAPSPTAPTKAAIFPLPKGGPGGDAFAPDVAGLPDGRWLLVWTEGAPGGRAIRAQTLAPDFTPVGDPIALSPPAGNFGQGVLGIAGQRATVVFLSKGKSAYELWGAILQCG